MSKKDDFKIIPMTDENLYHAPPPPIPLTAWDKVDREILKVVEEKMELTQKGRLYFGICPFHPEKTPSFTVNVEKNIFHCFGCGIGGRPEQFLTWWELKDDLMETHKKQSEER